MSRRLRSALTSLGRMRPRFTALLSFMPLPKWREFGRVFWAQITDIFSCPRGWVCGCRVGHPGPEQAATLVVRKNSSRRPLKRVLVMEPTQYRSGHDSAQRRQLMTVMQNRRWAIARPLRSAGTQRTMGPSSVEMAYPLAQDAIQSSSCVCAVGIEGVFANHAHG